MRFPPCLPSLQTPVNKGINKARRPPARCGHGPCGCMPEGWVCKEGIPPWRFKFLQSQLNLQQWRFKTPPHQTALGRPLEQLAEYLDRFGLCGVAHLWRDTQPWRDTLMVAGHCALPIGCMLGVIPCGHQHVVMPWWNYLCWGHAWAHVTLPLLGLRVGRAILCAVGGGVAG